MQRRTKQTRAHKKLGATAQRWSWHECISWSQSTWKIRSIDNVFGAWGVCSYVENQSNRIRVKTRLTPFPNNESSKTNKTMINQTACKILGKIKKNLAFHSQKLKNRGLAKGESSLCLLENRNSCLSYGKENNSIRMLYKESYSLTLQFFCLFGVT